MTIKHHPSEETLLRFATGTLGAGPALVVSVHLDRCDHCRQRLTSLEAVGGEILEKMPPASLPADFFGRTLERMHNNERLRVARTPSSTHPELGIELPRALDECELTPWKWLGPGFRWSKIKIPGSPDAKVMLLKGRAGLHLPVHGHTGLEVVQMLSGSLSDQRGEYLPGDLDEADDEVVHGPIVGTDSECICLAALEGDSHLHGFLGRLLRPFVGF
ncbi:MAG: ChrR family anti-sigma-E factor [Rhizobiaceae bacterium]